MVTIEERFVEKFTEILKRSIRCKGYEIKREAPVPYQHVYLNKKLQIWCFNQDIAICKPIFEVLNPNNENLALHDLAIEFRYSNRTATADEPENIEPIVVSEEDALIKKKGKKKEPTLQNIMFPLVTIEAKVGKNGRPTTDSILCAAKKAELIKSIFPFSKSLLVVFGTATPRTYRLSLSSFDDVICIKSDNPEELCQPGLKLKEELERARERIQRHFEDAKTYCKEFSKVK